MLGQLWFRPRSSSHDPSSALLLLLLAAAWQLFLLLLCFRRCCCCGGGVCFRTAAPLHRCGGLLAPLTLALLLLATEFVRRAVQMKLHI
jgi:hypothetical protein